MQEKPERIRWLLDHLEGELLQQWISPAYEEQTFRIFQRRKSLIKGGLKQSNIRGPIGQRLKSAPREDIFYGAMLRYVSCSPSCQEAPRLEITCK